MTNDAIALEVLNITKRFPGVLAYDPVNFDLRKGEIHALLGENGAGKSPLMNIIYGLYTPDEGEFLIDEGQGLHPVQIHSPHDAIGMGIGMVHQHFMLVQVFTVAENVILGSEITGGPSLDIRSANQKIQLLCPADVLGLVPQAVIEVL